MYKYTEVFGTRNQHYSNLSAIRKSTPPLHRQKKRGKSRNASGGMVDMSTRDLKIDRTLPAETKRILRKTRHVIRMADAILREYQKITCAQDKPAHKVA
jgi:hypothetical protein